MKNGPTSITKSDAEEGYARGVALEPDGDIVITGALGGSGSFGGSMFVGRLTPGLAPDPKFGTNGVVMVSVGGLSSVGNGVALASGGTVVAAGTVTLRPPVVGSQIVVAQLSSSGAVSWSKGLSGFQTFAVGNGVAVESGGADRGGR